MRYAVNVIGDDAGELRREFVAESTAMKYAWEQLLAARRVFVAIVVY